MAEPLALYVHWPFCVSKCPYCDFNSHVRDAVDQDAWRAALIADLRHEAALLPGRPRVDIAGDGPERRRLQGMAADLALDARFHGFVEEAARDALYRRSALLCVPSREISGLSEGAPLVIAEARQYGLPVVATAVGGIPELMAQAQPGSALVRPGAPALLAEALGRGLQLRCG